MADQSSTEACSPVPPEPCECEHISHFPENEGGTALSHHEYGAPCDGPSHAVRTVCGTFILCTSCKDGHMREFIVPLNEEVVA